MIDGTLTLNNYGVALTGSVADIKAALAGDFADDRVYYVIFSDNSGDVILPEDITAINSKTSGDITVFNQIIISGSSGDVDDAFTAINNNTGNAKAVLTTAIMIYQNFKILVIALQVK